MTTTRRPVRATSARAGMAALREQLRVAVEGPRDAHDAVTAALLARMPTLDVLTASQRRGDPDRLVSRVLHAEDLFTVVALVCRPGQQTTIHDHLTWCVVTVLSGTEQETVYRDRGDHLTPVVHSTNSTGSVTACAPPGDIHRVRNDADTTAISLHVYGTDLRVTGSSVRRTYDLPIREQATARHLGAPPTAQQTSDRRRDELISPSESCSRTARSSGASDVKERQPCRTSQQPPKTSTRRSPRPSRPRATAAGPAW